MISQWGVIVSGYSSGGFLPVGQVCLCCTHSASRAWLPGGFMGRWPLSDFIQSVRVQELVALPGQPEPALRKAWPRTCSRLCWRLLVWAAGSSYSSFPSVLDVSSLFSLQEPGEGKKPIRAHLTLTECAVGLYWSNH